MLIFDLLKFVDFWEILKFLCWDTMVIFELLKLPQDAHFTYILGVWFLKYP